MWYLVDNVVKPHIGATLLTPSIIFNFRYILSKNALLKLIMQHTDAYTIIWYIISLTLPINAHALCFPDWDRFRNPHHKFKILRDGHVLATHRINRKHNHNRVYYGTRFSFFIDRFDSTELYGNSPLLLQTVYNPKNMTEASAFSSGTHAQKLEVVIAFALELQK